MKLPENENHGFRVFSYTYSGKAKKLSKSFSVDESPVVSFCLAINIFGNKDSQEKVEICVLLFWLELNVIHSTAQ